jgi:hypothetical protein
MGTWEHIKLGELPRHNTLGFFCWGRYLTIHIEIKRELFMLQYNKENCNFKIQTEGSSAQSRPQ